MPAIGPKNPGGIAISGTFVSDPPSLPAERPPQNVMVAIGFKLASVVAFLGMITLIKLLSDLPPGQLVFGRSFFAILPIVAFLAWRGELVEGIKTKKPLGHVGRSLVGMGGMVFSFLALTKLPLPEAVSIGYAAPLLIVIFGAVLLKESVRIYRWTAVLVGLVGVGIIVWPRLTFLDGSAQAADLALGAAAALAGCVFAAFATIFVRTLTKTERSATIVLYFSVIGSLLALTSLPFGWVWPTPQQAMTLVAAGICGGLGQILLTESYRHADVSAVAPFEYTSLLFSIMIGVLLFNDVPTGEMLIGAIIVIGSSLFIIYREHRLGIERRRARSVTPLQ